VNDGFIDAIKHYDYKDSSLDKAVDDLQSKVSLLNQTLPVDYNVITQGIRDSQGLIYLRSYCFTWPWAVNI